jgi:hypothetical protein
MESIESAIEFNSEVAVKLGIGLESVAKTTELETKDDDDSYNSINESLEDQFDDSDMEGEELTLFNNGIKVCKKCAATNQFINDDAHNIDFGNGKELVQQDKRIPGSPDGWKLPSPSDSWKGYQPKWGAPK